MAIDIPLVFLVPARAGNEYQTCLIGSGLETDRAFRCTLREEFGPQLVWRDTAASFERAVHLVSRAYEIKIAVADGGSLVFCLDVGDAHGD
jgi:hypothetical protein